MNSDDDYINIPDLEYRTKHLIPTTIKRGLAKELIAAKGNTKAISALSLQYRLSSQAAGYISNLQLKDIEQSQKRR
ncbi:hypothetical protein GE543_17190 [Pseudomonas sp. SZ57]|uniref:Uncharacterized protein n=3 Tax=Pseudomonas syringae group TaxID=136849 RepID=A0AAD0GQT3_9PSED|nr:hypothetical protein BKM03_15815 [Pseudomonas avellanae]KWS26697.1 hypothetical protein AL061_15080 [Pseudomonas syringae pv. syringae]KWS66648.1 hypothetical protein AL055_20510 [Pseudomonas amygdali pv. morsprunorum]MQQ36019.1 hypothetical protein [Pseudomonas sp. SZ57]RMO73979.1 hypothetical protein ALQ36_103114 [Pseudomonas syringae pv. primulae]